MKILEGHEKEYKDWYEKNSDGYVELVLHMLKDGQKC